MGLTLIRSQNPPSILDVSRVLSGRLMDELDSTQLSLLRTEKALSGEYESGRALRLLLKLGFVNERPENGGNRRWSQSGDCYVLTLFRDYVFHQADGAGQPIMNLGHVITALNKLDAADEEKNCFELSGRKIIDGRKLCRCGSMFGLGISRIVLWIRAITIISPTSETALLKEVI